MYTKLARTAEEWHISTISSRNFKVFNPCINSTIYYFFSIFCKSYTPLLLYSFPKTYFVCIIHCGHHRGRHHKKKEVECEKRIIFNAFNNKKRFITTIAYLFWLGLKRKLQNKLKRNNLFLQTYLFIFPWLKA